MCGVQTVRFLLTQVPLFLLANAAGPSHKAENNRDGLSLLQFTTNRARFAMSPSNESISMHSLYTVGCDLYQLQQAVVLDHTWKAVGNTGRLTRIVVNCKDDKSRELLRKSVLEGDDRFAVFFSEGELMQVPGKDRYPARGRPHAISQWLKATKPTETVMTILDPDFIYNQPISSHPDLPKVRPGQMLAQMYDLGLDYIEGFAAAGEKAPPMTWDESIRSYSTGPPWVLHSEDLQNMLPDWARYTDAWPASKGLLREQDAFCMAALRHNVPAIGQKNFMVSNPLAWNEDWSDKSKQRGNWTPYVLHYCSSYRFGKWFFYKSTISDGYYASDFQNTIPGPLQCGAPLLQEPPVPPTGEDVELNSFKQAWMLWKVFPALNQAFTAYRKMHCQEDNVEEVRLVRTMEPRRCKHGTATRYRVLQGEAPAWFSYGAHDEDPCAEESQAPRL